jgi:tRNA(fMet)-specific endonuclease VapC
MNYLLDTHHAVALWRGNSALQRRVALAGEGAVLHLCVPVVGEMWYRIFNTPQAAENEKSLSPFLTRFPIVDLDAAAAIEFGMVKTSMQRIRRPISDVDAQTAAIARAREMTVLSAEQHFAAIPRLRSENWMG